MLIFTNGGQEMVKIVMTTDRTLMSEYPSIYTISDLEIAQSKITRDIGSGVISSLPDELQRRLNKAKYHIRSLETKLERFEKSSKLEEELDALKIKVKSQEVLLKEKEENLKLIKKEATKSNKEIQKLKKYIDSIKGHGLK